jgi:hypothetical protein
MSLLVIILYHRLCSVMLFAESVFLISRFLPFLTHKILDLVRYSRDVHSLFISLPLLVSIIYLILTLPVYFTTINHVGTIIFIHLYNAFHCHSLPLIYTVQVTVTHLQCAFHCHSFTLCLSLSLIYTACLYLNLNLN